MPGAHPNKVSRRLLLLAAPFVLAPTGLRAAGATRTPPQPQGPFYPSRLPQDRDADLTLFGQRRPDGEVIEIAGRILDLSSRPVAGADVEIWHCDSSGRYAHVGLNNWGWADRGFQGYGVVRTGGDGAYRFVTIRPGIYPGRVRHTHMKVVTPEHRPLTTQMYFPEEADNGDDFLLRRVGDAAAQAALIATRIDGPPARYVFDIFLA